MSRFFLFLSVFAVAFLVFFTSRALYDFYESIDEFKVVAMSPEIYGSERLLEEKYRNLDQYFDLADKWYFRYSGINRIMNRVVFKDAEFYEGLIAFRKGDMRGAREIFDDMSDDWRAMRLATGANFEIIRTACLRGECPDDDHEDVIRLRNYCHKALTLSPDGGFPSEGTSDIRNFDLCWTSMDGGDLGDAARSEPGDGNGEGEPQPVGFPGGDGDEGDAMVVPQPGDSDDMPGLLPQQGSAGGFPGRIRTP